MEIFNTVKIELMAYEIYHNNPTYLDKKPWANIVKQDQTTP